MKTLLQTLTFLVISFSSFSQKSTQISDKEVEEIIYNNKINNLEKYHNIESHFIFGLEGDISKADLLINLLSENKLIINSSIDDKSRSLIVVTNKTKENEIIEFIKNIIYSNAYNISSFNELFYKK